VTTRWLYQLGCGLLALAALTGCSGSGNVSNVTKRAKLSSRAANGNVTNYSPYVAIGQGNARAYVTLNGNTPVYIGVEMDEICASTVPYPAFNVGNEYQFASPAGLNTTPIQGISITFFSAHPPAGFGDVPHFHPNFFLTSLAVRNTITDNDPRGLVAVAANEIPAGHIFPGVVNAFEGGVSFDPIQDSNREQPFTTINEAYDFLNGHMILIQTGATIAFLQNKQNAYSLLSLPKNFPTPGYYPTYYFTLYDKTRHIYNLGIGGFVQHQ
jgi:hypothetical protein